MIILTYQLNGEIKIMRKDIMVDIETLGKGENVLQTDTNEIRVNKAKVLREVPEEEWKNWIEDDILIF